MTLPFLSRGDAPRAADPLGHMTGLAIAAIILPEMLLERNRRS